MNISLSERILKAYQEGKPMPLKGKARIILTDPKTGAQEVTESENMITNAVASILANNWNLYGNFAKLLPLKNLFSGVMCFNANITENADNYNPPNDNDNELICHAGDAPTTGGTLRGSPNPEAYTETANSIKFVWDFPLEVGNSNPINCVCLVPGSLGNMGLKPYDNTLNVVSQFQVKNEMAQGTAFVITEDTCIKFPISIDYTDGKTGKAIWWDGTTFKEITTTHDYLSFGVVRGDKDFTAGASRTATVRATTAAHGFIFSDASYYYACEVTSATTIQIDKIAKSDMTVTTNDLTVSGVSLYSGQFYGTGLPQFFKCVPPWPYDGTYLYLPNSTLDGFIAVNIGNAADVVEISGTVADLNNYIRNNRKPGNFLPVIISPGLIWFNKYLINHDTAYNLAECPNLNTDNRGDGCMYATYKKGASMYGMPYKNGIDFTFDAGPFLLGMFLSSINNLPAPGVTKTNIKTMRIEYLITES